MDKELEIALTAYAIVDNAYDAVHREETPQAVRNYLWRVRHHLSERLDQVAFHFDN